MKRNLWLMIVTRLAYCLDEEVWNAIEYLKEQVRVPIEQHEKHRRILNRRHKDYQSIARRMRPLHLQTRTTRRKAG